MLAQASVPAVCIHRPARRIGDSLFAALPLNRNGDAEINVGRVPLAVHDILAMDGTPIETREVASIGKQ